MDSALLIGPREWLVLHRKALTLDSGSQSAHCCRIFALAILYSRVTRFIE